MTTASSSPSYKGYRFPAEIISHALWLYYRFPLSYHDVEELLAERGIVLTYQTLRQCCRTFGQQYANRWPCSPLWTWAPPYGPHPTTGAACVY